MENGVRRLRAARGLGQQELARLAGISRQTLGSIESGRSDPSTGIALALSRALECTVEELFFPDLARVALQARRARPLSAAARPSRRVALASVGGQWVAHALCAGSMATAADGILPSRGGKVRPLRPPESLRAGLLAVGCDPALGLLAAHLGERQRLLWLPATSTSALKALARGEAHVAGAHLFDESSGEFNLPFVRALLPGRDLLVVNLARWRAGLAVQRGNPRGIRSAADLGRSDVRIVNREPGSGARRLLDLQLGKHGVRSVQGYARELSGHAAVAQAVAAGAADAGVTTESAALAEGLRFIALAEERSDLVLPLELARDPRGARLLETLASAAFRRDLGAVAAYQTRQCGDVLAEVRA
jgi:molybdate-binding protein/DNA-binding XRE family transcriptional regulator